MPILNYICWSRVYIDRYLLWYILRLLFYIGKRSYFVMFLCMCRQSSSVRHEHYPTIRVSFDSFVPFGCDFISLRIKNMFDNSCFDNNCEIFTTINIYNNISQDITSPCSVIFQLSFVTNRLHFWAVFTCFLLSSVYETLVKCAFKTEMSFASRQN